MEGGGIRALRLLRLLLVVVVILAGVEFMTGSVSERSKIHTYFVANITTVNVNQTQQWPKRTQTRPQLRLSRLIVTTGEVNQSVTTSTERVTTLSDIIRPSSISGVLFDSLDISSNTGFVSNNNMCPRIPPGLAGPINANVSDIDLDVLDETMYPNVQRGGKYSPSNCTSRYKVAIIVPFRDRRKHLAIFLHHMHPFLMKQQLDYGIFVIEQVGDKRFNRAKLMNVGFAEAQRLRPGGWDCFVFHDVDLLPIDDRNIYNCPKQPRHLSIAINTLSYKLPYQDIFGGVSSMTVEQFKKVNGFSNNYWGWGGEDDDMSARLRMQGFHIARYPMSVGRYIMLTHSKQLPNPRRYQLLRLTNKTFMMDGLSSLTYKVLEISEHHLYTNILVKIDINGS